MLSLFLNSLLLITTGMTFQTTPNEFNEEDAKMPDAMVFEEGAEVDYEQFKGGSFLFEDFVFEYPDGYLAEIRKEAYSTSNKIGVIEGENGRIELFITSDFEGELLGEPMHGFSSSGLDEFEYKVVPKEKWALGNLSLWLFYKEGDKETAETLREMMSPASIPDGYSSGYDWEIMPNI